MSTYTNSNKQIVTAFYNGNAISKGYVNNKVVLNNNLRVLNIHSIVESARINIKYNNITLSSYDNLIAFVPLNASVEYTVTKENYPIEKKTINILYNTNIEVDLSTLDIDKTYNVTYDENLYSVIQVDNYLRIQGTSKSTVNISSDFIITEG